MQKWEYGLLHMGSQVRWSTGAGIREWSNRDIDMVVLLNQLGGDGWELAASSSGTNHSNYMFKRRIE